MKNKTILNRLKSVYFNDLVFAKQCGYEAVILPLSNESEPCYLEDCSDEYIYEIADENGWAKFVVINFVKKLDSLFDLYDAA